MVTPALDWCDENKLLMQNLERSTATPRAGLAPLFQLG